jgi:hypothetical protein
VAFDYETVTIVRGGREHRRPFVAENEFRRGDVVRLNGRDWLVGRSSCSASSSYSRSIHVCGMRLRVRNSCSR